MSASESVITSELYPDQVLSNVGVKERQVIKVQPRDSTSTYTVTTGSQPIVRFVLPNSYYCNLHNLQLRFTATISGGTTPSFENLISCVFQRVRIMYNSTVLLDERAYNLKETIMFYATASSYITTYMGGMLGVESQANRRTFAAGREYIIWPFRNLCEDKLLPVPLLKGNIYLEFYTENPNRCIESATAVTNYAISNPVLILNGVVPSDTYEMQVKEIINAGKCQYLWRGTNYYINTCTSTSNNIRIPEVCKSLKKMYMVQRLGANMADITVNNKLNNWAFNTVSQYFFKINGLVFPAEPVNVSASGNEPWVNMLGTVYDHSQLDDPFELYRDMTFITYATFVTNKFLIAEQFDKYKGGARDGVTSGLDISQNAAGVLISLQEAATADNNLEVFTERDVIMIINPSGDCVIVE